MADCGCTSGGVDTRIIAGQGIRVRGIGTAGEPFVVESSIQQAQGGDTPSIDMSTEGAVIRGKVRLAPLLAVENPPAGTVDLHMRGAGVEGSPFVLSAELAGGVDLRGGAVGDHLQKQPDGTWAPGPANQVPPGPGLPSTSGVIIGDGTGANPIRLNPAMTYADLEALTA